MNMSRMLKNGAASSLIAAMIGAMLGVEAQAARHGAQIPSKGSVPTASSIAVIPGLPTASPVVFSVPAGADGVVGALAASKPISAVTGDEAKADVSVAASAATGLFDHAASGRVGSPPVAAKNMSGSVRPGLSPAPTPKQRHQALKAQFHALTRAQMAGSRNPALSETIGRINDEIHALKARHPELNKMSGWTKAAIGLAFLGGVVVIGTTSLPWAYLTLLLGISALELRSR